MQLPSEGESRLVPFGEWAGKVFVSFWRPLDHGYFLIKYTNAKSGKSNSWKWAIVKEGLGKGAWDSLKREWTRDLSNPTWIPIALVSKGMTQGELAWKITVYPRDEDDYKWSWSTQAKCRDFDIAADWMIGIAGVMYGLDFAGE